MKAPELPLSTITAAERYSCLRTLYLAWICSKRMPKDTVCPCFQQEGWAAPTDAGAAGSTAAHASSDTAERLLGPTDCTTDELRGPWQVRQCFWPDVAYVSIPVSSYLYILAPRPQLMNLICSSDRPLTKVCKVTKRLS